MSGKGLMRLGKRVGRPVAILQQALVKYGQDDGPWLAAAMAYYASFSLFPLLLVLVSIVGLLLRFSPGAQDAQQQALILIARNTSPALAYQVNQLLSGVKAQAGVGGPVGLVVLLFGAGSFFAGLDAAFDRLWNVVPSAMGGILATARYVLRQRLQAFLMLLALGALVVVAFVGGLALSAIGALASQLPAGQAGWQIAQVGISITVDTIVFATIYKVLPKPFVDWRDAAPGALFAAIVWELGKLLLAWIVIGQHYSAYGVVGAFIALMAWIYYACTIFFVGAEMVQALCRERERALKRRQVARGAAAAPRTLALARRGARRAALIENTPPDAGAPAATPAGQAPAAGKPHHPAGEGPRPGSPRTTGRRAWLGVLGASVAALIGAAYSALHAARRR